MSAQEESMDFVECDLALALVQDMVDNILELVDGRIADIHMEGLVLPQVVDYARSVIIECLDVRPYFVLGSQFNPLKALDS